VAIRPLAHVRRLMSRHASAGVEFQHSTYAGLRNHGPDCVLCALQRCGLHENSCGVIRVKSFRKVARNDRRIHIAVLDLQGHSALEVDQQRGDPAVRPLNTTTLPNFAGGADRAQKYDLRLVFMPAGADLIGDIPDLERVRVHASFGHESADARYAHQHAVSRQLAQGPGWRSSVPLPTRAPARFPKARARPRADHRPRSAQGCIASPGGSGGLLGVAADMDQERDTELGTRLPVLQA